MIRANPELAKIAFIGKLEYIKDRPVVKVLKAWTKSDDFYYVDIYSFCSIGFMEKNKEYVFLLSKDIKSSDVETYGLTMFDGLLKEKSKAKGIITKLNHKFGRGVIEKEN